MRRVIGKMESVTDGGSEPTLIVIGGLHGNEPSGVLAAASVLETLSKHDVGFRGRLVALAGNLQALAARERFMQSDLNRHWTESKIRRLRAAGDTDTLAGEDRELVELLHELEAAIASSQGEVFFVDLHTSSAHGPPFVTVGDTLRNRRFAFYLALPTVLGLEEQIDGALLEYLNNRGVITMAVEGGSHLAESSVENHTAALWMALASAGMVDPKKVPDWDVLVARLNDAHRGIPPVIEVRYRHGIRPDEHFEMVPGFTNFDRIRKKQVLAKNRSGEIIAREDGRILLPLYQGKGNDGFFVARAVRPFWLHLSTWLRRLGAASFVRRLPGVRVHPTRPDTLVVNTRIAKFFPLEIFHLLGFRKLRWSGAHLMVSKRRFDIGGPIKDLSFEPSAQDLGST